MSLQTWKDEFYPVEASEVSKENAIQHSLAKWRGLTEENLKKHRVIVKERCLEGKYNHHEWITIDSETCALCHLYSNDIESDCIDCPLKKYFGERCDNNDDGVYYRWVVHNDPHPMIEALERCLELNKSQV